MAFDFAKPNPKPLRALIYIYTVFLSIFSLVESRTLGLDSISGPKDSLVYLWPLPSEFTYGNDTLAVDPDLSLAVGGIGGGSAIVSAAFERYKAIIFKQSSWSSKSRLRAKSAYDINKIRIIVHSDNEELQLGVDESYSLMVSRSNDRSIIGEATIEGNTVFGAVRGLENVLHWHIIDEESFPLEVPTYPNLWKGAYTKWERYTTEDAYEIVNVLHSMSSCCQIVKLCQDERGAGYPDLWPSPSCREPLDVSKNFTFDVIAGILTDAEPCSLCILSNVRYAGGTSQDLTYKSFSCKKITFCVLGLRNMRKIFPFEFFHLGGDEVHTDCWTSTPHVKQWLQDHNMTAKDAYQYFVLRAQEIAISKNWTPVNWEETFNTFPTKLNPRTVVHNWLGGGVCQQAVAKGFRCIFSNQGFWYLDHLDVPWNEVYDAEPLKGINDISAQQLVLGGEVCMWAETADPSNVLQTIWPRAAAAAERLWSKREALSSGNITITVLPRLQYFRCLLTRRGVPAAPVTNRYARMAPPGTGSCYEQ
ncbi:beta-hexosaminidase 1 [Actinidia rufa]|uniref:Beta-hexosaminidase n=1 Tax=Actinidia rufa TaxID=165716 RepID=A0A7J0GWH4_9ERIC|nr:beta-hexosaminidase 1 [Actinidia rufa]